MKKNDDLAVSVATPARERMTREDRVAYIAGLMRLLAWETGRTGPALAKEWGVHEVTVRQDAAEASRIVRRELEDPDEVCVDVGVALSEVLRRSFLAFSQGDMNAGKLVIEAARTWARIAGIEGPQRVSIEESTRNRMEKMTPSERVAEFRSMAGRLIREAERLEAIEAES